MKGSDTATDLVYKLAQYKAASAPAVLKRSVEHAWADHWFAMVTIVIQDALAASLLAAAGKGLVLDSGAAATPELDALLVWQRWGQ